MTYNIKASIVCPDLPTDTGQIGTCIIYIKNLTRWSTVQCLFENKYNIM